MTEPSKEAIERACEMLSCSTTQTHLHPVTPVARFIQDVSDVAEEVASYLATGARPFELLSALILPDPEPEEDAEADLQEAAQAAGWPDELVIGLVKLARKNGLKISKVSE